MTGKSVLPESGYLAQNMSPLGKSGIIPSYAVKVCHCEWFNKQADWLIAEQSKVRQRNQTENAGNKKGRVIMVASQTHTS